MLMLISKGSLTPPLKEKLSGFSFCFCVVLRLSFGRWSFVVHSLLSSFDDPIAVCHIHRSYIFVVIRAAMLSTVLTPFYFLDLLLH